MRNAFAIAKKELNVYFTTPIAYAMFAVMTVFASYFFVFFVKQFLDASLNAMQMSVNPSILNMTDFVVAPVVFNCGFAVALIAPFLSMRLLADEKRHGTFEFLMTAPMRPIDIVLGKYLGGVTIMAVTIGLTLLLPVVLNLFAAGSGTGGSGGIEWGSALAAYFGLFLWAAAAMAIGMFISSLTDSSAVAAIISLLLLVLLWLASLMANGTDGAVREVLMFLSASQHLVNFVKGAFALKDVTYYLSWIVLGLFLTHRSIESHRWS